jgi:hypothetical protein
VIILFGSLTTVDPGDIHGTLAACVRARVRVSVVALAAEMKICRELCAQTGGARFLPHRTRRRRCTLTARAQARSASR